MLATALLTSVTISLMPSTVWKVWFAREPISVATTAKPRPASPARAASIFAFKASRLVWEEIFLMSSVSSLILATALDCSMAISLFSRIVSYMDSALSLEVFVVSRSCLARMRTSLEAACPSADKERMESASLRMVFTFPEIMEVLAVVSCIPAASCCVVAELSSETALFSCMI